MRFVIVFALLFLGTLPFETSPVGVSPAAAQEGFQWTWENYQAMRRNRANPKQCPQGYFFHDIRGTCEVKVQGGCAPGCYRGSVRGCTCDCPPGCFYNHASSDCRKRMGSSNRRC